jgi:Uma2 family endonuclease
MSDDGCDDAIMIEPRRDDGHLTARQYFAMAECGIFSPDERVELLDGLIVAMTPQSPWHASTVSRIHSVLQSRLPARTYIRIQSSFRVDDSCVPEPDLAVVPGTFEDYCYEHPAEAHLIVEVGYTSLIQDRITKAAIYARAGIPCYWVINLRDLCVEEFRQPNPRTSTYAIVERRSGEQTCAIDAFPALRFRAADLLPPPDAPISGRDE